MGKIIKSKLDFYLKKLYQGEFKLFKQKQKKNENITYSLFYSQQSKATKGKRIGVSSSQGTVIKDKYKAKCAICKNTYDFEIHHINGDRSYTFTKNLALLCHRCHKQIHIYSKSKLKDYKVKKQSSKKREPSYNPLGINFKF